MTLDGVLKHTLQKLLFRFSSSFLRQRLAMRGLIGTASCNAEQSTQTLGLRFIQHRRAAQMPLLGRRTVAAQVRIELVTVLQLAALRDANALGDALVGLELVTHCNP